MSQFVIPQFVFPVGTTASGAFAVGAPISSFGMSVDCSLWVLPATITLTVEASFDGGTTWRHLVGLKQDTPPPWNGSSVLTFNGSYPVTSISPTHVRATVVVSGNALTIGPGTLTVA